MKSYKDVHDAFIGTVSDVMSKGNDITVRDMPTKELQGHCFKVEHADMRMLAIPERGTNPFAQIAETMWMLAGRDDLDWLELYIPQCKKWSDDGDTWRGAYGPRLRNYKFDKLSPEMGVDQLDEVRALLRQDPETRQAVMTIWNPELDWAKSKDIPCNNWLQFIIRDELLHMHVAVRSNDAIYGFSHNDFFSWSVLLQMMAHWAGCRSGSITWFAGSYHIYDKHYKLARKIALCKTNSIYDFLEMNGQKINPIPIFDTEFQYFNTALDMVFKAESATRSMMEEGNKFVLENVQGYDNWLDCFMHSCMTMMCSYVCYKVGDIKQAVDLINSMNDYDMKIAGIVYYIRQGMSMDQFSHSYKLKHVENFVRMIWQEIR